jgi:hypothetical protein
MEKNIYDDIKERLLAAADRKNPTDKDKLMLEAAAVIVAAAIVQKELIAEIRKLLPETKTTKKIRKSDSKPTKVKV